MRRVVPWLAALALTVPLLGATPALAAPARPGVLPPVTTGNATTGDDLQAARADVQVAAATLSVVGHGWGHGRGMGQYGALGYAVDHGWSSAQILDHYYGGTRADRIPDLPIGVELTALRGGTVAVMAPGLTVGGARTGTLAVLVERNGAGTLRVRTGPGCGGPWTEAGTHPAGTTVTSSDGVVRVCEAGQVRGYRGNVRFAESSSRMVVVNQLPVEQYLRGVVPRESSASWASLGGGRGAQALQAQSVAARSYALSATFSSYATTCDTTACQVYGGAFTQSQTSGAVTTLEDPRTDAAVAASAGLVRRGAGGSVSRTEFSSSTGGWTAGGAFPAVQDLGDAVSLNPNRTWTTSFGMADVAARLGTGAVDDIVVTRRNGLGVDGGRVLEVAVVSGGTRRTFTGNEVRIELGLKSDWFSFPGYVSTTAARAVVQSLYVDLLGRPATAAETSARTAEITGGRTPASVALEVARSQERGQSVVVGVYQQALGRTPVEGEIQGWIAQFRAQGSVPALQSAVLASEEAWVRSGGDPRAWVDRLYRTTLGRGASGAEQDYWSGLLGPRGRQGVALGIAGSSEAGQRRLGSYYGVLLGRAPDPGAQVHLPRLVGTGDGDLTVPSALASSPEYLSRSLLRYP
ncbi:SpoIID/LytB domain-containing protein [Aquipuribacter hungaricus]|uniref:SpoIID/LytB domain-containing protein n=1 Tax=Aquipuribacter hungaricus TaxID=545624 RepID=UPI00361BF91F